MDDYIKREDFLKTWCESYCRPKQNCRDDCSFYDAITQFPAADVREDKKGMWLHDKDDEIISGYCNCCGWAAIVMETDVADMPFCPNCGADMRGEKDE